MLVWESIRIGWRAILIYPLRSILNVLGIIVGVGAVISMVAVGRGAQERIADQIRGLGSNLLVVQPGAAREGRTRLEIGSQHTLTESDARAIQQGLTSVDIAAPAVNGIAQLIYRNKNWRTTVHGTVPTYFQAREWPIESGRYYSDYEIDRVSKVALIGMTVAKALFKDQDPIGRKIRIGKVPVTVIGVLSKKGSSMSGRDQDNIVFIPISTAKARNLSGPHRINRDAVKYILIKVKEDQQLADAKNNIEHLLNDRRTFRTHKKNNFRIRDPASAMSAQQESSRTFTILLAAIASISLVVGGISIMNIMLVSVAERTREIGIRLANGARPSDIRRQFLVEAIILCILGAGIGVIAGIITAAVISSLTGWSVFIGLEAPLIAILAAFLIGLFFGYYPASRAARQDPITALRYE